MFSRVSRTSVLVVLWLMMHSRSENVLPTMVDDDQFELTWAARDQPGAHVVVVPGGYEVGQDPGPGGRGGHECKAARAKESRLALKK